MTQDANHRPPDALPEFQTPGVVLRVLLLANLAGLVAALIRSRDALELVQSFSEIAAVLEPTLALALTLFYLGTGWLTRLPYIWGAAAVLVATVACTLLMMHASKVAGEALSSYASARAVALSILLAALLLAYFFWRRRAYSPALADARLQALQARIRPHFLFNSINAVLSLIRSDRGRAEAALEDMAELYRALMQDNRQLTSLQAELQLCAQYLRLEQLRLGERLIVDWDVAEAPDDAAVPQLLLQPLIENAIYHGIEPGAEPGRLSIHLGRDGNRLSILIAHPYDPQHQHRAGNRMALANLSQRLALHFDVEADLEAKVREGCFEIRIALPYRKMPAASRA